LDKLKSDTQDGGIVLSPQRRSFGSGCLGPPSATGETSIGSNLGPQGAINKLLMGPVAPAPNLQRNSVAPTQRFTNSAKSTGGGKMAGAAGFGWRNQRSFGQEVGLQP